ncbi:aminotransferase class III-fold pyridoxal phosphate-dependent enzyme [Streptomyces sp. ODS28]|uniref:aminotransferase class III-fold pyridoxal phosphate-dependent enzyme n=1 Tax=Streptomyces sp. ODS28 TaxID=3136688 RepID=UPI0031EAACCF
MPTPSVALIDQLLGRQARRESAARTCARSLPVAPVRAEGCWVTGADGRSYLDFVSGSGTLALGHRHPAVLEALGEDLASGAPLQALDMITPQKDAFCGELLGALPGELRDAARLHFCGPGRSDAVRAAMRLAREATGRRGVVAFAGAHRDAAPERGEVTRLPFPYAYRCPFGGGTRAGDGAGGRTGRGRGSGGRGSEGAELSARLLEGLLDDPGSGVDAPAAVLLEAVQGEGGVIAAPRAWLREVRRITEERGIVLIVDEALTGVGRTGRTWACERAGITPDVLVAGGALGGGLPLAVLAYRPELDVWRPGAHTGDFRGTTLAMSAGRATLRTVAGERLDERAGELGERLRRGLRELAAWFPRFGDVRGEGLLIGVEIVDPGGETDAQGAPPRDPTYAAALQAACLEEGLMLESAGREGAVLRLLPPLVLTGREADSALERIAAAVRAGEGAA